MTRSAGSPRPLARRVAVALFGVGALGIAVTAAVFFTLWSQQTLARDVTELQRQVQVIASGVAVSDVIPGTPADTEGSRARLLTVEAGLINARLSVADAGGTVLYSTAGASSAKSYAIGSLARTGSSFDARSAVLDVPGVGRVAVVAVPVAFIAADRPSRYLVGAQSLSDLSAGNAWVLSSIGIAAALALIVSWFLGAWLARRVTGPLVRLTESARAIAAGDWGRQAPVEGDDEVTALAHAFNNMSTRVATAYRAQQEFVGDVSHEIRTPVTSIRGFADAIADGTVSDREGVVRAAGIIGREADRLGELTSTLLTLSDLDAGAVVLAREAVDVRVLVETLRERFGARAAKHGIALELGPGQGAPRADADRVLQALSTLMDNAIRHTPQDGTVRVCWGVARRRWRAEVHDSGAGIAPQDRERVFRRFARLDASRSESSGGYGLGLAICRRLVELMDGSMSVADSSELGGALFTIDLPAA
jgi:two-component system sensor histidine kinase BaeS